MLEAVLSARRVLYVSWTGRNVRDNSELPPSVLVSQFRDYLAAGWRGDVLGPRTTEHPLQPFSRRYFEGGELFTHAREWRAAHDVQAGGPAAFVPVAFERSAALTLDTLVAFLRHPVREFFRRRLGVVFSDRDAAAEDEEVFAIGGLMEYQLVRELVADAGDAEPVGALARRVESLQRAGRLPIGALGVRRQDQLIRDVEPMLLRWREVMAQYPDAAPKVPLRLEHEAVLLDDWLDGLRTDGTHTVWSELLPHRVLHGKGGSRAPVPRPDQLMRAWVRALAAGACGAPVGGVIVGRDAWVSVQPVEQAEARSLLGYPEDREGVILLSLGYPVRPLAPVKHPDRRPLAEVVHREHW